MLNAECWMLDAECGTPGQTIWHAASAFRICHLAFVI
jgi:hypothetical protein